MAWELSDEHEMLRKMVRDFAEAEIAPHAAQWDRDHHFPVDVVHADGRARPVRDRLPRAVGRQRRRLRLAVRRDRGARPRRPVDGHHAVGRRRPRAPTRSSSSGRRAKGRWLPDLVAGRALGAFGLTEPDGGSDAGATRTKARASRRRMGDQRLQGVHHQLRHADHVARHGHRAHRGRHLGVRRAGRNTRAHRRARLPQARVARQRHARHDPRRLPSARRQSARRAGSGFRNFLQILDDGRIAISALALGCARACLEHSVEYAKQRHAFGGPIGRFQGLAFQLADLAVAVENAHNLIYKAAWLKDRGRPIRQAAAMAKLYSTETAVTATRVATQVFGGAGFIEESPIVRFYRDAKILEIGEGTSEIQRLVLARGLGLPVG